MSPVSGSKGIPKMTTSAKTITTEALRKQVKHIIVISLDACAAGHLGCYGYHRRTSPNLDKLAFDGIRLAQFFCEYPNTAVNFRPMMISRYPEMNEHWATFPQMRKGDSRNLPEYFKDAGFATASFSGNSFYGPRHGYKEGWDTFETAPEMAGHLRANRITDMALQWLDQRDPKRERLLLWAHYLEPHNPYHAPAPWDHMFAQEYPVCPSPDGKGEFMPIAAAEAKRQPPNDAVRHVEAAYDGSLAFADDQIGRLLSRLREKGVLDEALLLVTADHGEGWGEHNRYSHNNCIYDEEMKVPFIVCLPPPLQRKRIVTDAIAESVDILPTLLDAAAILPPRLDADGVSLLPLLTGQAESVKEHVYGRAGQEGNHTQASPKHVYSIRTRTRKLVWDTLTDRHELYDIANDPGEKNNLYNPCDENCMQLQAQLERWMKQREEQDRKR